MCLHLKSHFPTPLNSALAAQEKTMILFTTTEDDSDFIEILNNICHGLSYDYSPQYFCIIQIDNWFDHKWLNFSGKALGALGFWKKRRTLPPFNPNRVKNQRIYKLSEEKEYCEVSGRSIHIFQDSENNFQRHLDQWSDGIAFFWYSSNTQTNGRGSLMVYISGAEAENQVAWYTSFTQKDDAWKINRTLDISRLELERFTNFSNMNFS